jgi:HK97 family phage portal protein
MDFLAGLLTGSLTGTPPPDHDFWYQPTGTMTPAGMRIDADGAKKISAWFRGRDILATSLAMLPLHLYERLPDDAGANVARTHQLYDVLHRKPNPYGAGDSFTWRRQAMFDLIDYGHAYDLIGVGREWSLRRIDPQLVRYELMENGRALFHVRDPKTGKTHTYTQDEVFHREASDGKGILEFARDSLGLARVTDTYAGKVFGNGTLNAGMIEVPGPMNTESAQALAQSFKTAVGDWHMPKVLPQGAKWAAADGLTPDKAQMLLSRKFSINDIARWLGLPPHMLGDLDRATFSNIEHQGQEFVTYALGPWLSLWEFAINDQLVLQPGRFYAEFTRDALVRGDIATRWAAHVESVNAGIKTVDEVRRVENLNRRGGEADKLRIPQNITGKPKPTAGKPAQRPEPEPEPDEDAANARARAIVAESAARVLRKEVKAMQQLAVRHAADADLFAEAVTTFYEAHAALVSQTLQMELDAAAAYCAGQAAQMLEHGVGALDSWTQPHYAEGLATWALEGEMAA